ncbi:protein of unknown function [Pseudomonas mediterranea]
MAKTASQILKGMFSENVEPAQKQGAGLVQLILNQRVKLAQARACALERFNQQWQRFVHQKWAHG